MKRMKTLSVLIDTNVIIDAVLERNSNREKAAEILHHCITKEINGYVTSHSLCDFFYITRKNIDISLRRKILLMLVNNFTVLVEPNSEFKNVLEKDFFFDIEDGLQMECAESAGLDYIITENLKDFTHSTVPAVGIMEFAGI